MCIMSYILNNAHYTQMLGDLSEGSSDGMMTILVSHIQRLPLAMEA